MSGALIGYMWVSKADGSQAVDLQRGVGLRVLAGQGANIDTNTANGPLVFGIFAALAEFERELIVERTVAGLQAARARGRNGGRPFKMTSAKLRLAQAAMGQPETKLAELCAELGITRQTLYRHVIPTARSGRTARSCSAGGQSGRATVFNNLRP